MPKLSGSGNCKCGSTLKAFQRWGRAGSSQMRWKSELFTPLRILFDLTGCQAEQSTSLHSCGVATAQLDR